MGFDEGKVYGDSQVLDDAVVMDTAEVYQNAKIYNKAIVRGDADISGNVRIYNFAKVSGKFKYGVMSQLETTPSLKIKQNLWQC